MAPIQISLHGAVAAGVVRRLANDYARAVVKSRVTYSQQLSDAPWAPDSWPSGTLGWGDPTLYRRFTAWNEAQRQSLKATLLSLGHELPPVPDVPLRGPYKAPHPHMSFSRFAMRETAAAWAAAFIETAGIK